MHRAIVEITHRSFFTMCIKSLHCAHKHRRLYYFHILNMTVFRVVLMRYIRFCITHQVIFIDIEEKNIYLAIVMQYIVTLELFILPQDLYLRVHVALLLQNPPWVRVPTTYKLELYVLNVKFFSILVVHTWLTVSIVQHNTKENII